MPRNLEARRIEPTEDNARQMRRLMLENYLDIGVPESQAKTIADPESDQGVSTQLNKLKNPNKDVRYDGFYEPSDEEMLGFARTGLMRRGDIAAYGNYERARHFLRVAQSPFNPEKRPYGLQAFAVKQGLAHAALTLVRHEIIPASAPLMAEVHEADEELHDAFTQLGSQYDGPYAQKQYGDHKAMYILRELPPLEK